MTWNFDWDAIIHITDYMLIIGPVCQYYLITSIKYGWGNISLNEVKIKGTNIFNDICCQVKVNSTLTTIAGFMFDYKEFLAVEPTANPLA